MAPLGDENMAREREGVAIQLANLQRELGILRKEKEAIVTQRDESDALYKRTLDLLKKRDAELEAVAAESSHHQQDALQMASSMDDLQKQITSLKAEKDAHDSRLQKEFARYTSLQESISLLHDTLANLAQTTKASADTAATSLRLLEQTKPAQIQFKPSGSGVGNTAEAVDEEEVVDLVGDSPPRSSYERMHAHEWGRIPQGPNLWLIPSGTIRHRTIQLANEEPILQIP